MARQSFWDDTLLNTDVASGAQVGTLLTATPGGQSEGFTLVRTIITLSFTPSTVLANDGAQAVDLGIGLITKEAQAAGVFPDSNTNTEQPMGDWVWRTREVLTGDNSVMLRRIRVHANIKAGRKLAAGVFVLVANNSPLVGTAFTAKVVGVIRMLILRP